MHGLKGYKGGSVLLHRELRTGRGWPVLPIRKDPAVTVELGPTSTVVNRLPSLHLARKFFLEFMNLDLDFNRTPE